MKKKISLLINCFCILFLSDIGAVPYFSDEIYGDQYTKHPNYQYAEDENGHGKTYITISATSDDDPYIWAYDHQLKKWEGPVFVAQNYLQTSDLHGNPSLLVDQQGYIHIWYGKHGNAGLNQRGYARSVNPHDISTWETPVTNYEKRTYPQPILADDGTIYVFYRAGNQGDPWSVVNSADNGATWSTPRIILKTAHASEGTLFYAQMVKHPNRDRLCIGIGDVAMPGRTPLSTDDIFYIEYDYSADQIYNVEGTAIPNSGNGLSRTELINYAHVEDFEALGNTDFRIKSIPFVAPDGTVYISTLQGNPAYFTAQIPENEGETNGGKNRFYYYDTDQNKWIPKDDNLGKNFRYEDDKLITWGGWSAARKYESTDKGKTWKMVQETFVANETSDMSLFTKTQQYHPDAAIVLYNKTNGKGYLVGNKGVINMATDEITHLSAPDQVRQAETMAVSVHYETTEPRELTVALQLNSSPWTTYGTNKGTLSERTGTVNVEITVNANIPPSDDAYKIVAYMYPTGTGYNERLDLATKIDVDALEKITSSNAEPLLQTDPIVYPTMVEDILYFKKELRSVKLFSASGKMVLSYENKCRELDMSYLPSGIYFFKVDNHIIKILKK